jgi:catechol 2,3-dioxygenase-like lactoylglutathione lyase family enzyme
MNRNPRLHHVGIVQPGEDEARALMALLGLEEDYRGFVERWSALCIFTRAGRGSPVEFVIPRGGPLERFNKGAGGLHHIALEVPDIRGLARALRSADMKLIEPEPIKGAGNFLCNFLNPAYTRGLTVEFVQPLE